MKYRDIENPSQATSVVRATVKVNERPHFWPLTARKHLNRIRQNSTQIITSATRHFMPTLVFVPSAGARPRIGEFVILGVYFYHGYLVSK